VSKDVRVYLLDILACAEKILRYTRQGREASLSSDLIVDAVIRNFEVIGEAAKRVPDEVRAQYPQVPWRRVCGFRDVLIHAYDRVDLGELWNVVANDLPLLIEVVERMLAEHRGS
jgi:uncharacterized protein with HEPN domain